MEHDLTKICQSLPVSSSGSVSIQAHNILEALTGASEDFDINSGGTLPTLKTPNIVENTLNQVSFSGNASNGSWNQVTEGKIDGVSVTSPITVTPALSGKVLVVTTSAEHFNSSSASKQLTYHGPVTGDFTIYLHNPGAAIAGPPGSGWPVRYPAWSIAMMMGTDGQGLTFHVSGSGSYSLYPKIEYAEGLFTKGCALGVTANGQSVPANSEYSGTFAVYLEAGTLPRDLPINRASVWAPRWYKNFHNYDGNTDTSLGNKYYGDYTSIERPEPWVIPTKWTVDMSWIDEDDTIVAISHGEGTGYLFNNILYQILVDDTYLVTSNQRFKLAGEVHVWLSE